MRKFCVLWMNLDWWPSVLKDEVLASSIEEFASSLKEWLRMNPKMAISVRMYMYNNASPSKKK